MNKALSAMLNKTSMASTANFNSQIQGNCSDGSGSTLSNQLMNAMLVGVKPENTNNIKFSLPLTTDMMISPTIDVNQPAILPKTKSIKIERANEELTKNNKILTTISDTNKNYSSTINYSNPTFLSTNTTNYLESSNFSIIDTTKPNNLGLISMTPTTSFQIPNTFSSPITPFTFSHPPQLLSQSFINQYLPASSFHSPYPHNMLYNYTNNFSTNSLGDVCDICSDRVNFKF